MIYLLLSIGSSTIILILFRLFKSFQIDTKQAIVMNYISAFLFGLWSYKYTIDLEVVINSKWIYGAVGLGALFILIFNLMAITAQKNGLSVVSVASKMSVIIPILVGVFLYNEVLSLPQVTGILCAFIAVYLTSVKPGDKAKLGHSILFPFLVFLGSGIIDSSLKYFENFHLTEELISLFSACIFCFAALFGFIWILGIEKHKLGTFKLKTVGAGLILGVVNYYSIYFLMRTLKLDWLNSATIFTINNVSIVALSCIVGYLMFKESISRLNFTGIILALVSIYLISYSS